LRTATPHQQRIEDLTAAAFRDIDGAIQPQVHVAAACTYGEVEVGPFVQLLEDAVSAHRNHREERCPDEIGWERLTGGGHAPSRGEGRKGASSGMFVDLGSGTGKAVFAASLSGWFDSCLGIEILPELHDLAETALAMGLSHLTEEEEANMSSVRLLCGDLMTPSGVDLSRASVVYVASTCFNPKIMTRIGHLAGQLPPGGVVLSLTRPVPFESAEIESQFEIASKRITFSWGPVDVFMHRRIDTEAALAGAAQVAAAAVAVALHGARDAD